MIKVNVADIREDNSTSPKGVFSRANKDLSIALGRRPESADFRERHPFGVQICRIPAGKTRCPFHMHTAQFEFFPRTIWPRLSAHADGTMAIGPGDVFMFGPEEPHQIINNGTEDLLVYIVADNPVGDACYYPDSKKWLIESREPMILRSEPIEYFDGEE